jgi:hypothetical protein
VVHAYEEPKKQASYCNADQHPGREQFDTPSVEVPPVAVDSYNIAQDKEKQEQDSRVCDGYGQGHERRGHNTDPCAKTGLRNATSVTAQIAELEER